MARLREITEHCTALLRPELFEDYCPNGLQVDGGRAEVARVVTGVTASQALIDAAAAAGAELLLVHHGFFWKGEPAPLTGIKGRRVRSLMQHGISLLAYHLPLDAHIELGNNAQLGALLGFIDAAPSARQGSLLWRGRLTSPLAGSTLAARIDDALGRRPLHVAAGERPIATVAWCSGAAQGAIVEAAAAGCDAFVSGEISEQTVHLARELGVDYYAAGHHATERLGVQALGAALAERFGVEHRYIEIPNPV